MLTVQNIKEAITGKDATEQLQILAAMLETHSVATPAERSLIYAERGKILWALGRRGESISAYEKGARLDPDGPAALLLEHTRSIMDFFNPDLLNP